LLRCFFVIIILSFLAGCTNDAALIKEQQAKLQELDNEIIQLEKTIKNQQTVINEYE
jgi:outer membrane murein-binding lipoprotein Lpp